MNSTGPYADQYDASEGVAIVGMAGRFPGSRDIRAFWRNILAEVDSISHFSKEVLEPSFREDMLARAQPGYVCARGVLEDIDRFDEAFFGFTPAEAALLDPQQRLFLQAAWESLEHAGHDPDCFAGLIGVFAGGTANSYYLNHLQSRPDVTDKLGLLTTQMANQGHYIATRAAYKLNLRGPALNIHTACSTSLVAVCTAVQSLQSYQCDLALAGGVSVTLPQRRGYLHQEGSILSPDGICRAFDADAAGTVFSNGLGVVVLRRLADALQDGNTIYAVIKGAALNNDGHDKLSFTAPSIQGQAEVISLAQAAAGIDPQTISYVETHGTGTQLGDPIEVAALTQAFRAGGDQRHGACALGSVKTQIGHLDAAAGVTGLIRAALALHHRVLPATLHFDSPNPKLALEDSPFYVNRHVCPWPEGQSPRRAAVSSFGVGGTNAHVVLEESPARPTGSNASTHFEHRSEQLVVLSAHDEAALERSVQGLRDHLSALTEPLSASDWADIAHTLQDGRHAFPWRRAWACAGKDDALLQLARQPGKPVRVRDPLRVAFLFPGQGSQQVNAGRGLYASEPLFRNEIDACAAVLLKPLGLDIREVMFPPAGQEQSARERLSQTIYTQPALLVLQLALARLWMGWGLKPAVVLGHSVGEFAAACLAGTFSRDDALLLVAERGRLMQGLQPGAMLAVRAAPADLQAELAEGVDLAAVNGPKATVLAGPLGAVARVEARLESRGVSYKVLPSTRAFHSSMMDPIMNAFAQRMAAVPRKAPQVPWVSSMSGRLVTSEEAVSNEYWVQQMRAPVHFAQASACCVSLCDATLEMGSGDTLTRLTQQQPAARELLAKVVSLAQTSSVGTQEIESKPGVEAERIEILQAAGQLWCAGARLEWSAMHAARPRRVPLPTYPFALNRHWVDPAPRAGDAPISAASIPSAAKAVPGCQTPTEARAMVMPSASDDFGRRAQVMRQLQDLFADLAGIDAHSLDPAANLLEFGLDSLILTQASQALNKQFGVKVPMRALLEDLSSLNALADHLLTLLPAQPIQVAPTPQAVDAVVSATQLQMNTSPTSAPVPLAQDWLELFAQQLSLMGEQLQMLRSAGAAAPGAQTHQIVANSAVVSDKRQPVATQAVQPHVKTSATDSAPAPAFGPFRPPQRGSGGAAVLTAQQQTGLQDFIARYVLRTQASKVLTQRNRQHLADPRSVAGFRQLWKELVYPLVTERSQGAHLWDVDGNRYIDITNGFGMILFGHNPPFVRQALLAQLEAGYEIGPQSPLAGEVAGALCQMVGMERAAFCATGSEAVMAAIRLARTVTGRDRIVVFNGAYHGIFDEVLVRPARAAGAASGESSASVGRAVPIAPGIPAAMADNIVVLEYGAPESLRAIEAMGTTVAAVLVEPVQSRRPDLQPLAFLQALRKLTSEAESALIFDEVVTGFRCHPGGAQALFGIRADLATYGKVLGGGMPIGVVAGAARFMDALDGGAWRYGDNSAPEVGVTFFAGTFVRHPMALAAARAVLTHLHESGPQLQQQLNARCQNLAAALQAQADGLGVPLKVSQFSSWFHFQWTADLPFSALFYPAMRMRGIHVWEGRPCFITTAHGDAELQAITSAVRESLSELQKLGLLPMPKPTPVVAANDSAVSSATSPDQPPVAGARKGRDQEGREAWFVPDPERPGKYLQVVQSMVKNV